MIRDLFHGRVDRNGYALLLRNLLPAYQAMEAALADARHHGQLRGIAAPELERAPCLIGDLTAICGSHWHTDLPLLPAGLRYARRIARIAHGPAARLAAHAYVRYLGDLSGGQILKRLLARSLGLGPEALTFYAFPAIADVAATKRRFRAALDLAAADAANQGALLAEATVAFRLNIAVSEAVANAVARRPMSMLTETAA